MAGDYTGCLLFGLIMIREKAKEWLGDLYEEYIKIIDTQPTSTYTEKHHILPKSLFPEFENEVSNLVDLDFVDHLRAHEVLTKTNEPKMYFAFFMMASTTKEEFESLSDLEKFDMYKLYAKAREETIKLKSEWGKSRVGKLNNFYGKRQTDYAKKIASETHKGKKLSAEHTISFGQAQTGVPKRKVECPHCHKMIGYHLINRWHNDNCKMRGE